MSDVLRLASERQRRATAPDSSAWVEANAGTGKTKVLTDRVTRLLLQGVRPERILCLTFTKAAAAEMAGRVFNRLASWVTRDDAALKDELLELLGREPTPKELTLARDLFAIAMETPGGARPLVVHVNGAFHSDFHFGTVSRAQRRLPGKRIAVVTVAPSTCRNTSISSPHNGLWPTA